MEKKNGSYCSIWGGNIGVVDKKTETTNLGLWGGNTNERECRVLGIITNKMECTV